MYLCSTTEFHEALRLPLLFEHYAEHRSLVSDLTFFEFLAMHYKTDKAHDDRDHQLPFKVPGHEFATQVVAIPVARISLQENNTFTHVSHLSPYREAFFESQLSDIFQPPKI